MIPQKLTIEGLYSYQAAQTIDFTRLIESQLFGIFGTVGSGKSSILEAIAFAIYGQTERLNQADGRNYNMMNLKSNRLLIDFECINAKLEHWRFVVEGKRNSRQFEKVNTFSRRILKREDDGSWTPVEDANPDDIIGLSYDNFRRTIIIPQGKFQEFLQLGATDRTRMLKEIFDLDRFEFSMQTGALINREKERSENLRGQLKQHEGLDEASITLQKEKLAALEEAVQTSDQTLGRLRKEESRLALIQQKAEMREKLARELAGMEARGAEIEDAETQLKAYEACVRIFAEPVRTAERLRAERDGLQASFDALSAEQQKVAGELGAAVRALDEIRPEYEKRDLRQREADDLSGMLRIRTEMESLDGLKEKLGAKKTQTQELAAKAEAAKGALDALQAKLREMEETAPDMAKLAEIRNWYVLRLGHKMQLDKAAHEAEAAQAELEKCRESFRRGCEKMELSLGILAEADAGTAELIALLMQDEELTGRDRVQAAQRCEQLAVQVKLEDFAGALEEGRACPLCGATHHPEPLHGKSAAQLKHARDVLKKLDERLEEIRKFTRGFDKLGGQLETAKTQLDKLQTKVRDAQGVLAEHLSAFVWSGFDPEDRAQLDAAFRAAEAHQASYRQGRAKRDADEKTLRGLQEELEALKADMQKLQDQAGKFEANIEAEIRQLKVLQWPDYGLMPSPEIKKQRDQILEKRSKTVEAFDKLEAAVRELENRQGEIKGSLEVVKRDLASRSAECKAAEETLQKLITDSDHAGLAAVKQVLDLRLDAEKLRGEILAFRERRSRIRTKLSELEAETGGQQFDAEAFEALRQQLKEEEAAHQNAVKELGAAQKELVRLEKNLGEKRELEQQLAQAEHRLGDLDTLRKLFARSGFVEYISTVYLRQLCEVANRRFYKLSRQQLRLELSADNKFEVRDFLNEGRLRSVKTLSGGQTFQASLCLALALAESVQSRSKSRQNFFFLDEGFGSLDRESLQTVFATLKSLREESRVVGIISHVEELQQEIDVFLKIGNDAQRGSRVYPSWQGLPG
ncbi:MAG: SMC family ATPase [Balneolales bacterium]|nr:SMC family ATPase [Balneolales bacterium]